MSENTRLTKQLKLRPYQEWPPCDGHPRPAVWPALAKILERGTITVISDPIENKGEPSEAGIYSLPKCDSTLFWRIAEPDIVGFVCLHCVDVNQSAVVEEEPLFGFAPLLQMILGTTGNGQSDSSSDSKKKLADSCSEQVEEASSRTPEGDWVN